MRTSLFVLLASAAIHAQSQAPSFEVASVKVSPKRSGTAAFTALDADPALVRYANITLRNLIALAWSIDARLVIGPAWVDSDPFDVNAKLPPDTPKDRVPAMLQALLTERFKLAIHRESKEQKVYHLVVAKNGPKLKPGREEGGQNQMLPGRIMGGSMPMSVFASMLTRFAGNEVIDKTGLSGTYDIDLKFKSERGQTDLADLFAALQEVGLKLESGKGPVQTLVVDHAERVPIDN